MVRAFSLVEAMISLVIISFIIGGVMFVFSLASRYASADNTSMKMAIKLDNVITRYKQIGGDKIFSKEELLLLKRQERVKKVITNAHLWGIDINAIAVSISPLILDIRWNISFKDKNKTKNIMLPTKFFISGGGIAK